MNRGDIVLVAAKGEYSGKPRPALIVQSDLFNPIHASVTVCLITSELYDAPLFRPTLEPSSENGLKKRSQIMVDKIFSAKRTSIGQKVGVANGGAMREVEKALKLWLQLA